MPAAPALALCLIAESPIPSLVPRGSAGDRGAGHQPPQLVHGQEDHCGLGLAHEQGGVGWGVGC